MKSMKKKLAILLSFQSFSTEKKIHKEKSKEKYKTKLFTNEPEFFLLQKVGSDFNRK